MDKALEEKALKALERQQKENIRKNKWLDENCDRMTITMPKGTQEKIREAGFTVNGFVSRLVKEELARIYGEET